MKNFTLPFVGFEEKYKKYQQTSELVPLFQLLPKTSELKSFYKENGLSKLLPSLKFRIHTDEKECLLLWNKFTSKKTLFELWDFRSAFSSGHGQKTFFFAFYNNTEPVGLLPLVYDEKQKRYEWYGTDWQEENRFFQKDKHIFPLLFAMLPSSIQCNSIVEEDIDEDYRERFVADDPQFFLQLVNINSMEDLLKTFSKKHRYNLRRDYNQILEHKPKVKWVVNPTEQLRQVFAIRDLSMKRFQTNGDRSSSMFRFDNYFKSFINIIRNQGDYSIKILVVKDKERTIAVDMIALYKDVYYLLTGASDIENYSGLGNFLNYLELEDAIVNKYKVVNALQEDNYWKHKYFSSRPLLKLK